LQPFKSIDNIHIAYKVTELIKNDGIKTQPLQTYASSQQTILP